MPPFRRGVLAVAAAATVLAAAGPAAAIDMSLRSPFLPPVNGSGSSGALSLAAQGRELIVAIQRDTRAVTILQRHGARRLGETIWLVDG